MDRKKFQNFFKKRIIPLVAAVTITTTAVFSGKFLSVQVSPEDNVINVEGQGDGLTAEVSGNIPGNAELKIEKLSEDRQNEYESFLNSQYDGEYEVIGVYSLELNNDEGSSVQPGDAVEINLLGEDVEQAIQNERQFIVFQNKEPLEENVSNELEENVIKEEIVEVNEDIIEDLETVEDEQPDLDDNVQSVNPEENNYENEDIIQLSEEPDNSEMVIIGLGNNDEEELDEEEIAQNPGDINTDEYIPQERIPLEDAEIVKLNTTNSMNSISFTTDKVTEFVIALRSTGTLKGVQLGEHESFEIDKYLENRGVEWNGQETYNVYLEQAYYNTSSSAKQSMAPLAQHMIFLVDQSTTMRNEPIEILNQGMRNVFNQMLKENQERMARARAGEYADIDSSLPEQQLKEAMKDHLLYVTAVTGYNWKLYERTYNGSTIWDIAPLTQEDADRMYTAAHVMNDNDTPEGQIDRTGDIQTGTHTGMTLEHAYDIIRNNIHYGIKYMGDGSTKKICTDSVVLLTDGMPNGTGSGTSNAMNVTGEDVDRSIAASQRIKDLGATVFAVYERNILTKEVSVAYEANNGKGDIDKIILPGFANIRAVFMGILSSDTPKGGSIPYDRDHLFNVEHPAYANDRNSWYHVNDDYKNRFGRYTYLGQDAGDLINIMKEVCQQAISDSKKSNYTKYAGADSYIQDVVSDPFEIMDINAIKVYAVPRIPANMDSNNIPIGIVDDETSPDYGKVRDFRWGEQRKEDGTTEWEDVTDQVKISVRGNVIQVSGYDYESNAVVDFDKDVISIKEDSNPLQYKAGDYGYKLVVVFPISAKLTFGGNNIETNNSDTTAFFPSEPDEEVYWEDNTTYNPNRNPYIEKYPVPHVDLKINYKIVSDSINVYAPQTAELKNLVTNENKEMWYMDSRYDELAQIVKNTKNEYDDAVDIASAASSQGLENAEELWCDTEIKYQKYLEAKNNFEGLESYMPDGINNAFVDISYALKDPDGEVVATMNIPHGKAYVEDQNGKGNINWSFVGGENAIITKSGEYTIECRVSPANTTKAPGGHVSTELDDEGTRTQIPYDSQNYSPTGSSSSGTQTTTIITEEPKAYLFQLKIITGDTRLVRYQTIDFNEGTEPLMSTENKHILGYEWVCTDGVTESEENNEPGITGLRKVGNGVMISSQIPDKAKTEGLIEDREGITVTAAEDGGYVPVSVILTRNIGNLNKSVDELTQTTLHQASMSDNDNIWGDGLSSVIWEHVCKVEDECDQNEFNEAQGYNTSETSGKGPVRYLIHVMENPMPDVEKETDTSFIARGGDIEWKVTVKNNDEINNKNHRSSMFSLVDILPYVNDERIDPDTGREGSDFGGSLFVKKISVDMSAAPKAKDAKNGEYTLFYTTDEKVRTASEEQILGNAKGGISWTAVSGNESNGIISFSVPTDAKAVKYDMDLAWEETVLMNITANVIDTSQQQTGDYYHNEALALNGNGARSSNVVSTEVGEIYISGTIWKDMDSNGFISEEEPHVENIVVKLYQKYDPRNPGKPDLTINGIQLVKVYDTLDNEYPPIETTETGNFRFENILPGTYYIVAENIPEGFNPTIKQAGKGDEANATIDSEAEETYASTQEDGTSTAWIKEIVVGDSAVENLNIGIKPIKGSIIVYKTLDEIFYDSSMTNEDRENYQVKFSFRLKNKGTGQEYVQSCYIGEDNKQEDGTYLASVKFEDLLFGQYILTEEPMMMYTLDNIISSSQYAVYNSSAKQMTFQLGAEQYDFEVTAENILSEDPPGSTEPGVTNAVKAHIPINLEVVYCGPDTIKSDTLTKYQFQKSDFNPANGGDIIVTYDDGTQASIKEGTLRFEQISFVPRYVTNRMNTPKGDKYTIKAYYAENGHMVSDSFKVSINLKPPHKFTVIFDANTSMFDTGESKNIVNFAYDDELQENYVTKGIYKDSTNGSLKVLNGFTFAGWNTKEDGSGIQYSTRDALNEIGKDPTIKQRTLYAVWRTEVTFNAMGGKLSGGITDAERKVNGLSVGKIPMNLNQVIGTNLTVNRTYYTFIRWDTRSDGKGTALKDYGKVTGPVTFYAMAYQTGFPYTGSYQTFKAPVSGVYSMEAWGAHGGGGWKGGKGGYSKGNIHLNAGQTLYVYVGQEGDYRAGGSFNGGGSAGYWVWAGNRLYGGAGGGATDIRYSHSLGARIMVAGGGGGSDGADETSGYGGAGGGIYGESGRIGEIDRGSGSAGAGAGQTYGASFGTGGNGSDEDSGGGGGGYYGGYGSSYHNAGGGGGSGFVSGMTGCSTVGGYRFTNASMVTGRRDGHGYATIVLISED